MLEIRGTAIYLTRGDSAYIGINLRTGDMEYQLMEGDRLTFTVRKDPYSKQKLIEKTLTEPVISLRPEDTEGLSFGIYHYDVELKFQNGDVNTVIPVSEFHVEKEVTYD